MNFKSGFRVYYDGADGGNGSGAGAGGGAPSLLDGNSGGGNGNAGGTGGTPSADGGTGATDFKLPDNWDYRSVLPPELKESPSAKKYANIAELVRGADNLQQFVGRPADHLVELPPNAPPEARRSALEKMGLPKDIAAYKVEAPKAGADLLKLDHPNFKALTEVAFKAGILPDQFQGVIEQFGGLLAQGQKDMAEAEIKRNSDNIEALKAELGEAFDGDVAAANFAVGKLGGDELRASINRAGLGTDGPLLKMLAKVGKMLAEDEGGGDKPGGFGDGMTPQAAKDEGQRLLQEAINEPNLMKRREIEKKAQEFFAKAERRPK